MFSTLCRYLPLFLLTLATPAVCADAPAPSLSGVVSVTHRFGMAQACPVDPDLAITNSHVIDPFPLVKEAPYLRARWNGGYLLPLDASWAEDLALVERDANADPFPMTYPVAANAPAVGEQLWWGGYDWSKPGRALRFRTFTGRVVEVRGGVFSLDTETPGGTSGGCVLNARGEVVGVIAWGKEMDNQSSAAFAVSVWGRWFDLERARKALEAERAKRAGTK